MTITTDQAIELARKVGAPTYINAHSVALSNDELTALCNAARKQALLEAAVEFDRMAHGVAGAGVFPEKLRRMAGE
jgi:hypothetical protein